MPFLSIGSHVHLDPPIPYHRNIIHIVTPLQYFFFSGPCSSSVSQNYAYMSYNYIGHCPITPSSITDLVTTFVSNGPQLVYRCLPGLQPQGEMVSVCLSNGIWYPNPAGIVCTSNGNSTSMHMHLYTIIQLLSVMI